MLLTLLITLSLMIDLSSSFWIARSRLGRTRGRGFGRYGRSDPDMIDDEDVEDYEDDGELLNALADLIMEKDKRSFSSLIRNRDLRNLSSMYGKRGAAMMNPMAKNKGLGK